MQPARHQHFILAAHADLAKNADRANFFSSPLPDHFVFHFRWLPPAFAQPTPPLSNRWNVDREVP